MGYASGLGFGSVFWGQRKLVSESVEFTPLYQGISSSFWEGDNLTTRIEESMDSGELKGVKLFVFTNNLVFESVLYKKKLKTLLCLSLFSGYTRYKREGM